MINILNLIIASSVVLIPAIIASSFNTNTTWYISLKKPPLQPPSYIFGIVWPILYILLISSIYILSKKSVSNYLWATIAIGIILNSLWTYAFFYLNNITLAFNIIVAYLLILLLQYYMTFKINNVAGNLLIPLIIWVIFASYLNLYILINN